MPDKKVARPRGRNGMYTHLSWPSGERALSVNGFLIGGKADLALLERQIAWVRDEKKARKRR